VGAFALKPWVTGVGNVFFANPERGCDEGRDSTTLDATLSGFATTSKSILFPRVAAKRGNPGLELANAFSVILNPELQPGAGVSERLQRWEY
jgi:hypothetical protein